MAGRFPRRGRMEPTDGRRLKLRRQTIAVLVLAALVTVAWAALRAGAALVVDAPRISDTIVVLAGETDHRPARAVWLAAHGYSKRVILDVPRKASIYNVSQMQIAQQYIAGLPTGSVWLVCPIDGLSTRDEAREVQLCIDGLDPGTRSVLVVTSDFHTRRALSILRRRFPGRDISVAASYDASQFGEKWWTHREWAKV